MYPVNIFLCHHTVSYILFITYTPLWFIFFFPSSYEIIQCIFYILIYNLQFVIFCGFSFHMISFHFSSSLRSDSVYWYRSNTSCECFFFWDFHLFYFVIFFLVYRQNTTLFLLYFFLLDAIWCVFFCFFHILLFMFYLVRK